MRIIPIINRLKSNVALLNNRVEPARSIVALPDEEVKNNLPIAFVYANQESADGHTDMSNGQEVSKQFTVVYAVRNIDDDLTEEPLEDLREQVRAALQGWQYNDNPDYMPAAFISGQLIDVNRRVVWWRDTFTTQVYE